MKKKAPKAGADMEVANEIGRLNDSIGLAPNKLRNSEVSELTPS